MRKVLTASVLLMVFVLIFVACGSNNMSVGDGQTQAQNNYVDELVEPGQDIYLSRLFVTIMGHRLEPGMSFNEIMDLGFELAGLTDNIEGINARINLNSVWLDVNYIGDSSGVTVLNDVQIRLTFLYPQMPKV